MDGFWDNESLGRARELAAVKKASELLRLDEAMRAIWLDQIAGENPVFYHLVVKELSRRESHHDNHEPTCE